MNTLQQIRSAIEKLTPGDDLPRRKTEILTLVDTAINLYPDQDAHGNGHHQRLSPREREVMNMILSGRRLKEIAATLDISVKTVTTHRSRLLRKLGLEDNLGLYRYGVRHGLIGV